MGVKWRWETDARDRRAAGDERQRPPNAKTPPRAAPTQRARGSGTRAEDARQPRFSGGESRRPNNRNGTTIKDRDGATKKNQELSQPLIPLISLNHFLHFNRYPIVVGKRFNICTLMQYRTEHQTSYRTKW